MRCDFFENATGEGWYEELRDRLRDLYAATLAALGRARAGAGDLRGAAEAYQRLVELDSLNEDASRNLMSALIRQGDTDGATRVYRRLADALRRGTGRRAGTGDATIAADVLMTT